MAKLNHSASLSIGARVANSWGASVGAVTGGTDKIKKRLSGLKDEQRSITQSLRETTAAAERMGIEGSEAVSKLTKESAKLKGRQEAVAAELKKAQREAAKLGKAGSADVDRLLDVSEQLEHEQRAVTRRLDEARKAAAKLGREGSADVAKLRKEHDALGHALDRERSKLKTLKAWHELDVGGRTSSALKRIGGGLLEVGRAGLMAGAAIGATAAAGIGWFTKSALDATASMEQMETALTSIEGSSSKASAAMKWIANFGATTPYELDQVSEAFIKLRTYGIDPADGTLRNIGDTASAMGKDLMQAVEAYADALSGQNQRLLEFGIRSEKAGKSITYFYTQADGTAAKKKVKNNAKEIGAALKSIWEEKGFSGSMDKQSKTWKGLMSNLSDQWTQFQVRVMQGGVFDLLKGKAEQLLTTVNRWASDGTLERWAHKIGDAYKWAFARLEEGFVWVQANWPEIKQAFVEGGRVVKDVATWFYRMGKWASEAAGGPQNLAKGLAVLGAAKVLAPLGSLVSTGWGIVAWLSRAIGLTGALQARLAATGAAMKAAGGASAATASAGATAGGILAAGAVGYGVGTLIDNAVGFVRDDGKNASTLLGEWMSSDVDKQRAALLNDGRAGDIKPRSTDGMKSTRSAPSTTVNQSDQRTYNIKVEAKGADADEVADKVVRKLSASVRNEGRASYG